MKFIGGQRERLEDTQNALRKEVMKTTEKAEKKGKPKAMEKCEIFCKVKSQCH